VISDLQRRSLVELWRAPNVVQKRRILAAVAAEEPDFVAILGDLVFRGSWAGEWSDFDRETEPLRAAGVPVLPVLGNHDCWVSTRPAFALRSYFSRFPDLDGRRWYERRYGPLALLFCDSNSGQLAPAAWEEQLAFLEERLAAADADPRVRGTLVMLHHPPFTNSPKGWWEEVLHRSFLPRFTAARKTMAMLSGHIHHYERFRRGGRAYVVTGGVGPPVRGTPTRKRHADDLFGEPGKRYFHYLAGALDDGGVTFEMHALEPRGTGFTVRDRFTLPYPAQENERGARAPLRPSFP
jgi:3',5'-cyclic AMP phosphodiesterase CpdA